MRCENYQKQISRLVDKELDHDSSDLLLNHLQNCPECADFYARLGQVNHVLNSTRLVKPNPELAQRVKESIFQKRSGMVPNEMPVFWKRVPVYALVALLAVGIGNIAGKTLTQTLLDQNAESTLELIVPNGTEYFSDILSEMGQGDRGK